MVLRVNGIPCPLRTTSQAYSSVAAYDHWRTWPSTQKRGNHSL